MLKEEPKALRRTVKLEGTAGFETWRERLGAFFDVSLAPESNSAAFAAEAVTWQLSTAIVSRVISSTGQQLLRDNNRIQTRPADYVALYFCSGGRLRVEHETGVSELQAGDILFSDYTQPSTSYTSDFANVSLILDRKSVPAIFREVSLHGSVLTNDRAATRVITGFAHAICNHLDELATADGEAAVQAVAELAAHVWSKQIKRTVGLKGTDRLLDKAMTIIRDELENPALSSQLILDRLRISRTLLFKIFKERGGVRPAVLGLRLERALQALTTEPMQRGSVSSVAFRFAFKSEAHFSRAFTRRFGLTPSQVLAMRGRDVEALVHEIRARGTML